MKSSVNWSRAPRSPVLFGAALLVFAFAVLWPGFRLAGRLDDTTAALRLVSEQRRQAEVVAGALVSVRDRLESFGYVDEPLSEVRTGVAELDGLLHTLTSSETAVGAFATSPVRAVQGSDALRADVELFDKSWTEYRKALAPIASFQGVPYADSEAAGVQLNEAGRGLAQESRRAIVAARKQGPLLSGALAKVSADLEAESTRLSRYLRLLMLDRAGRRRRARRRPRLLARRAPPPGGAARRRPAARPPTSCAPSRRACSCSTRGGRIGATHSRLDDSACSTRGQLAGLRFERAAAPLVAGQDAGDRAEASSRCCGRNAPARTSCARSIRCRRSRSASTTAAATRDPLARVRLPPRRATAS